MNWKQSWRLLWVFGLGVLLSCAKPVDPDTPSDIRTRAGRAVLFDASGTDAKKSKYLWDFGDGTRGNGPQASHTYSTPGEYQATLTIKGGGKRGTANIRVIVEPPSPIDSFPPEVGAALVVDDIEEAAGLWELALRIPRLAQEMVYVRKVLEEEIGFFPLDSQALKERGFDPKKGVGIGIVQVEGTTQVVISVGTLPGGAALSWVIDWASRLGFVTEKDAYGEVTIWKVASEEPIAVLAEAGGFLLFVPALDTEGRYLDAIRLSLDAVQGTSLGDAAWVKEASAERGTSLYVKGGEFFQEILEVLAREDRELAPLATQFSSDKFPIRGLSVGLRAREGALELKWNNWLTEEGVRRYAALSPDVPWLKIEPSLLHSSVGYGLFVADLMVAAAHAAEGMSPSDRARIEPLLSMVQAFTGIDLGADFAEPLGPAGALVFTVDPDGLANVLGGGGLSLPVEVILAYEIEDLARLNTSLSKLASSLGALGALGSFQLKKYQVGSVDAYSFNFGLGSLDWAAKEGVFVLAVGPDNSTLEKALELIAPGRAPGANALTNGVGKNEFVFRLDKLQSVLARAQEKLKSRGQNKRELDEILSVVSLFQELKLVSFAEKEKMQIELVLKLSQP